MNIQFFKDPEKKYSVVVFLEEDVFMKAKSDLESLGKQRNIRLVVQPCPYEGVEFLYRIGHELISHQTSVEKDIFWQAIILKADVPDNVWSQISDHHYKYLCAILEQNVKAVEKEGKVLRSLSEYYD